jgi:hypothetical protein
MLKSRVLKQRHWSMTKDYCDGINLRDIEDKYRCTGTTITDAAKLIGIQPRPSGFSSYTVAHKWVLQARLDYERIKNEKA